MRVNLDTRIKWNKMLMDEIKKNKENNKKLPIKKQGSN
jgi:hypothetical protein